MKRLLTKLCFIGFILPLFSSAHANVLSAYDDFNIDVTSGWGTSRSGNAWVTQGAGAFSVDNSAGNVVLSSPYTNTHGLTNIGKANVEGTAVLHVDGATSSGYIDAGITLRHAFVATGQLTAYRAFLRFENGATRLVVGKVVSDSVDNFETFTLPVTAQSGENFVIKFVAYGTSPTKLASKAWPEQSAEPSDWQIITEDSESVLQSTNGFTGVSLATDFNYSGLGSVSYEDFFVAECGGSCATNFENTSNIFTANLLGSTSRNVVNTTHDHTDSFLLSSLTGGTPNYVKMHYLCNVKGGDGSAFNSIYFIDDNEDELLSVIGCDVSGVSSESLENNGTRIIPIPVGTVKVNIRTSFSVHESSTSNRTGVYLDFYGENN